MKELRKKHFILRILISLCYVFAAISLFISAVYTYWFFTAGFTIMTLGYIIRLLLTIIFEGVKSLMLIINNYVDSKYIKAATIAIIVISVCFTINAFLNDMDREKESNKFVREEYKEIEGDIKENKEDIVKKEGDIQKKQNEIDTQEQHKKDIVKSYADWATISKTNASSKYDEKIEKLKTEKTQLENELKSLKDEKKSLKDKLENETKYGYKQGESINTKIIDVVIGENKVNRIVIGVFMALLIEIMYSLCINVILKILYDVSRETLQKIRELETEKQAISKAVEIANSTAKEIKFREIKTNNQTNVNTNNHKLKSFTLVKKTDLSNLSIQIIQKAVENNGKLPSFAKLAEMIGVSKAKIEKAISELKENGKIEKDKKFFNLVDNLVETGGVEHEETKAN